MIHHIDPVAFNFIVPVRWYGLSYLLSYLIAAYLVPRYFFSRHIQHAKWDDKIAQYLLIAIIGGRIGHMLFYEFSHFVYQPISILKIWQGGLSFHGAVLFLSIYLFHESKYRLEKFLQISDLLCLCAPVGLFFGRIANFINSECYGKLTQMPWNVQFMYVDGLPRHPVQLYEATLEGLILGSILWLFYRKSKKGQTPGYITSSFLILYAVFRFFVEFWREPDGVIDFLGMIISYGQLYSIPLMISGCYLLYRSMCMNAIFMRDQLDKKH